MLLNSMPYLKFSTDEAVSGAIAKSNQSDGLTITPTFLSAIACRIITSYCNQEVHTQMKGDQICPGSRFIGDKGGFIAIT